MSVPTKKRLLLAVASLLTTSALLANPSPRTQIDLVYEPTTGNTVLFGGMSPFDNATQLNYYSAETWVWTGLRWVQRYPVHSPSARAAYAMAWDGEKVVMFGGRQGLTVFNDTWVWQNDDWRLLQTPTAPTARNYHTMTYDPLRDRIVLFGGNQLSADGKSFTTVYDTWEFDGTDWTRIATDGPKLNKPQVVWDGGRRETFVIGFDDTGKTQMHTYDPSTGRWTQKTPEGLPPCANDISLVYLEHVDKVALVGGACAGLYETAYSYNGTKWEKLVATSGIGYPATAGLAYDSLRNRAILYGGTELGGEARAHTYTYWNNDWHLETNAVARPAPRSLGAFISDPVTKSIWLVGGLNQHESGYLDDIWRFQNNQWTQVAKPADAPTNCGAPFMTFDSDRKQLVVVCSGLAVFELDVNTLAWKKFTTQNPTPGTRRFANFVYDPTLKQSVLYGGYGIDYLEDTWLWNGTAWTEVKKNRADARALATMFYDPTRKKLVLYGGIGRPDIEDAVIRYKDMWEFDGATNGWKKLTITQTPGERFGAQTVTDPRTGHTLLLGGIRVDQVTEKTRRQVFASDLWQWDGNAWTRLAETTTPPGRENAMFGYDPTSNKFVLFGGYAGFFFNDTWTSSDAITWQILPDAIAPRGRVVRR
jgi:hypothetical protein